MKKIGMVLMVVFSLSVFVGCNSNRVDYDVEANTESQQQMLDLGKAFKVCPQYYKLLQGKRAEELGVSEKRFLEYHNYDAEIYSLNCEGLKNYLSSYASMHAFAPATYGDRAVPVTFGDVDEYLTCIEGSEQECRKIFEPVKVLDDETARKRFVFWASEYHKYQEKADTLSSENGVKWETASLVAYNAFDDMYVCYGQLSKSDKSRIPELLPLKFHSWEFNGSMDQEKFEKILGWNYMEVDSMGAYSEEAHSAAQDYNAAIRDKACYE